MSKFLYPVGLKYQYQGICPVIPVILKKKAKKAQKLRINLHWEHWPIRHMVFLLKYQFYMCGFFCGTHDVELIEMLA